MENRFSALRELYFNHREYHGAYPDEATRVAYRSFSFELMTECNTALRNAWLDRRDDERYYADFVQQD